MLEFITPLAGKPYSRVEGVICARNYTDELYPYCDIIYEEFECNEFQYIFKPMYERIDACPNEFKNFIRIPGIALELRKECYYRVNLIPEFISVHVPPKNRVNLVEELKAVNLEVYDEMEYMFRTTARNPCDNNIVIRKETYLARKEM